MADIIRVFDFVVNFQEDKFERKDGSTDVITIVESDNKSTKFKFYFEEELQDGTNVLVKIKHNIGFAKDYVLCIKNKEAELVLTNSITIAGFLKMTISFVGNDNEILTPAQFQNKIFVKEAITGETPITEDDSKLLEGLISQVNLLNDDTKKAVEGIENTFDQINKKLDEKIETINEKDNEQDEDIKANKESIEKLHTENLEIKAENERLRNDIKSIALTGEASGENIHIEDGSNARCEIEICGNQKQNTREGYNFLDLSNFSTQTKNGVTATKNEDGSIKLVGTNSGDTFNINLSTINGEIGDYIASGVTGGSRETYFLAIVQTGVKTFTEVTNESSNFSLTEETTIAANIYIVKGATINTTIYPMLIKGTENKPYEQCGASPSFAYPSSVKAVSDVKNILNMSNAKGGTSGGITCNMIADGSYTYKGTASSKVINIWLLGSYNNKTSIFRLEPGTYYIDGVVLFDGNNVLANPDTAKIFTFINAHDITGVRTLDAVLENTYDETKYPIIAKIDHKIPWIPYNYGYAKIDIFNKNYLSKIPKKSITAQGITSTFDGEKFICKGTAQTNYFNLLTENVYKKIGKGIKTFSTNKLKKGRAFIHFDYVDGTGQNYYTSINTNQVSFTLNKDVESYRLNVDSITAGDTIDDNIYVQLEDGKIVTEIEKAENQEYLVDVQQEMLEGDTFVRQENKWYEKHGFGVSDTFNNENINISSTNIIETNGKNFYRHHLVFANDIKRKKGSYIKILSTHFKYNDSRWNTLEGICGWEAGNSFCIGTYDENYNTAEKMQTFLMNNHVKIYYELAESILLECTEAQSKVLDEIYNKAHTYKNITNISVESAEVNPIASVKYLKDAETEHNKLQAQIDEIKQLLSTTETSALLVNNLEKDLRMEVE